VLDGPSLGGGRVGYLAPGQIMTSDAGGTLKTVLGSCVSVTLFDPRLVMGGMNHFLLPGAAPDEQAERYGEGALTTLLARLERLGCGDDLQAGVFGGACVLGALADIMHLGERNVEFAFDWLRTKRIEIVARDVLGRQARRLEFRVADGSTRVRLLGEGT
jgi:chemotaxis protein CheD